MFKANFVFYFKTVKANKNIKHFKNKNVFHVEDKKQIQYMKYTTKYGENGVVMIINNISIKTQIKKKKE